MPLRSPAGKTSCAQGTKEDAFFELDHCPSTKLPCQPQTQLALIHTRPESPTALPPPPRCALCLASPARCTSHFLPLVRTRAGKGGWRATTNAAVPRQCRQGPPHLHRHGYQYHPITWWVLPCATTPPRSYPRASPSTMLAWFLLAHQQPGPRASAVRHALSSAVP
jgi:hypothetical protein